jgi:glycine cleavage system H protein
MSETLTFMMGEFEADFPTRLMYAKNHMWASSENERFRFGFSAYAVRLLQDVYFLDWIVGAGDQLKSRQEIGSIESKKAESDLFAPIAGQLIQLNEALLSDPSYINVDKYGAGWLFEMEGDGSDLLTPDDYLEHLQGVWEVTQRTIKGQLN